MFCVKRSVTAPEATAVLVMVPVDDGVTVSANDAVAPLARLPTDHVTTPEPFVALPVLGVAETNDTPAGNVSATLTEVAVAGPLLVSQSV